MRQTAKKASPMSNEGRNAYVIEHLTNALLELLQEKQLDDISISELCDMAGVGRATFYRNFETREDIIKRYINGLFSELADGQAQNGSHPENDFLRSLFAHIERHIDFYKLLNERHLIHLLKDVIIALCGPKPEDSKEAAYAKAFVAYTLYGWIEVWFQRGMADSPEEMAALFKNAEVLRL